MGQIVNLNKVRKQKAREDKDLRASRNRVIYGRSKLSKIKSVEGAGRKQRDLDGKALEPEKLIDPVTD